MNIDRTCQTCGGTGEIFADSMTVLGIPGGRVATGPCPHCTDGLVPVIALVKQGGQWPADVLRAMGTGFSAEILDAVAEILEVEGS